MLPALTAMDSGLTYKSIQSMARTRRPSVPSMKNLGSSETMKATRTAGTDFVFSMGLFRERDLANRGLTTTPIRHCQVHLTHPTHRFLLNLSTLLVGRINSMVLLLRTSALLNSSTSRLLTTFLLALKCRLVMLKFMSPM